MRSTTSLTLRVVADVGAAAGASIATEGRLCHLRGENLAAVLLEIDAALSATERTEARAVFVPSGEPTPQDVLDLAMGAPTLTELAARERYRDLALLADAPARFHARYQPIVELGSGATVAHEALLRADDGRGEEVPAGDLFAAAAAGGWTHVLDRIGRETAIRDAAGWLGDGRLFINFVPTSIYRPEVCLATTLAAARHHGIDFGQLTFEVVETHRTDDVRHLISVVEYYRERGARVALDDLGSGYSSLNLVAQVRPDVVKIDMELIQRLPDPTSVAIVSAIVELSHGLGATVIAEGVETAEQAEMSRDLGADLGQGWYFGRPVRPEESAAATTSGPGAASVVGATRT